MLAKTRLGICWVARRYWQRTCCVLCGTSHFLYQLLRVIYTSFYVIRLFLSDQRCTYIYIYSWRCIKEKSKNLTYFSFRERLSYTFCSRTKTLPSNMIVFFIKRNLKDIWKEIDIAGLIGLKLYLSFVSDKYICVFHYLTKRFTYRYNDITRKHDWVYRFIEWLKTKI